MKLRNIIRNHLLFLPKYTFVIIATFSAFRVIFQKLFNRSDTEIFYRRQKFEWPRRKKVRNLCRYSMRHPLTKVSAEYEKI